MQLFIPAFFCCIFTGTLSMPQRLEQSNSDEGEFEVYDGGNIDHSVGSEVESGQVSKAVIHDDPEKRRPDSNFYQQDYMQRTADFSRHSNGFESIPDYKINTQKDSVREEDADSSVDAAKDHQLLLKRNHPFRYVSYGAEVQSHNRESNSYKPNVPSDSAHDVSLYKRTIDSTPNESEMLFENIRSNNDKSKMPKNIEYSNDSSDTREHGRYFKEYFSPIQNERQGAIETYIRNVGRDRRQALTDNNEKSLSQKNNSVDISGNEDEEALIKRQIRKLSNNELQELLDSLSENKRSILKNIIEETSINENINKREITKKAGAVEDNANIENIQSDFNKIQGESSIAYSDSSALSKTDATETTKPPEQNENNYNVAGTKNSLNDSEYLEKSDLSENSNKAELKKSESNSIAYASEGNKESVPSETKSEIKREIQENYLKDSQTNMNSQNNYQAFDSPKEGMSQLLDDEYQLHYDNNDYKYKREINMGTNNCDISGSIKSLEDSFPNSNYDETDLYAGSEMVPLIRVKRKNSALLKKRSAGVMPDAKVAFVPFRAESDDEDNDEGNEFDDEGFYDRTSNNAKINDKQLDGDFRESELEGLERHNRRLKNVDGNLRNHNKGLHMVENPQGDTISVGSDTDNILSGVEGANDNLMYSSAIRNRRTSGNDIRTNKQQESIRTNIQETLVDNPSESANENLGNAPNYQENDAFGPLPRNYEGELGRYKRIRRVKQPNNMATEM